MAKFSFIKTEEILNVSIREKFYPVVKAGKGIPCLLICLGTPSFRTLSKNFASTFEVYSSDTYWVKGNDAIKNQESLTMDIILDDIKALADALNLKKYIIFAHSAYGIIALEFAKKYPDSVLGIIMVGTPLNISQEIAEINNKIFQSEADEKRKIIDAKRRQEIEHEELTKLDASKRWLREYIYRDAPRYWYIPDFDCTELREGIDLSNLFMKLFSDILPKAYVLKGLENIHTPIFLAAGMSDYDCCPWRWKEVVNLPRNFTISIFDKSGHWPHYEEAKLFNARIKEWLNTFRERRGFN